MAIAATSHRRAPLPLPLALALVLEGASRSAVAGADPTGLGSACACTPITKPRRVFFNRVPKCGSTTMESVINAARKKHGFHFRRSPDYTHQHLSLAQRRGFVRYFASNPRPFLYDRHLHHIRFEEFGTPSPVYINLIRDPVSMHVSDFYFHRECVCTVRSLWCVSEWHMRSAPFCNRSIDEAYGSRAVKPTPGFLTAFFCGHDKECAGSNHTRAVAVAKRHIRDRFLWVGVLEQFAQSLQLLGALLPHFFGGLDAHYWAAQKHRPAGTKKGAPPSEATAAKIRAELALDYELYDYVKQLLACKLRACAIPPEEGEREHSAPSASGEPQPVVPSTSHGLSASSLRLSVGDREGGGSAAPVAAIEVGRWRRHGAVDFH